VSKGANRRSVVQIWKNIYVKPKPMESKKADLVQFFVILAKMFRMMPPGPK
jgi:hypothetical protein